MTANQLSKRLRVYGQCVGFCALVLLAAMVATAAGASAAVLSTDKPDYAPGETIHIRGAGFGSAEIVSVHITHADGTPETGEGHQPWEVRANGSGGFVTDWIVPFDDNVDEILLITATGLTSGTISTTTVVDANTNLAFLSVPESVPPSTPFTIRFRLTQDCGGGDEAPLPGRAVLILLTQGANCGVDVGNEPDTTVITDAFGEATVHLVSPPVDFAVRLKFLGEEKPNPCPNPGNSVCAPTDPNASKRCVSLSNANICQVVSSITCDPLQSVCPPAASVSCESDVPPPDPSLVVCQGGCPPVVTAWIGDSPLTGGPCGGTIARTYRCTDALGNTSDCVQTITIDDNDPPSFPAGCTQADTFACVADVPAQALGGFDPLDNCDATVTVTATRTANGGAGCVDDPLVITDVYTATDDCGNTAHCRRVWTVIDDVAPTIICPADFAVERFVDIPTCDPSDATAADNCGTVTVTCSDGPLVGESCGGTVTRTFTATDACGNSASCTQTITVDDTTPPTIVCPADALYECGEDVPACDPADATASDNYGVQSVTCVDTPTATGLIRTYTATDSCGNSASCAQIITIDDDTPPIFVDCVPEIRVQCRADVPPCPATMPVFDECLGLIVAPVTCSDGPLVGGVCGGAITRTITVTDAAGNTATCIQIITVSDTQPPVITCPPDFTVGCFGDIPPCDPTEATATDNCGPVTLSCVDALIADGVVRTFTATDGCGNSASCTQRVVVIDTTPPVFVDCVPEIHVACVEDVPPCPTAMPIFDECLGLIVLPATCVDGPLVGGPCGGTITRTIAVSDAAGNVAACVQTITIDDTTPPTIVCPPDVTLECSASTDPDSTGRATATDNCLPAPVVNYIDEVHPGQCEGMSLVIRTWTATDACDNSATCVQLITLLDTAPPTLTCPSDVTVECGDPIDPAATGWATAVDACDPEPTVAYTESRAPGACPGEFFLYRIWTAADDCGNSTLCIQLITVDDSQGPVITCPPDVTIGCHDPVDPLSTGQATAADVCDPQPAIDYRDAVTPGSCASNYVIKRTWIATDLCGNVSQCVQTITAIDTAPPVFVSVPPPITVNGLAGLPPCTLDGVEVEDDCGEVTLTCTRAGLGGVSCGTIPVPVRYIFTAVDECGNRATFTRIVTVIMEPCNFFASAGPPDKGEIIAPVGSRITVPVRIDVVEEELEAVRLAFGYDPEALTLLDVDRGDAVSLWKSFTYDITVGDRPGSRMVVVQAAANLDGQSNLPTNAFWPRGVIAKLHFAVAPDRAREGQTLPIWSAQTDCGANCFLSHERDVAFVRKDVGDACGALAMPVSPAIVITPATVRLAAPVSEAGDINRNGAAYEVGDAVLLIDYLAGGDVFSADPFMRGLQIEASDVNADGVPATVADLVYLIRVISGAAMPIPGAKLSPFATEARIETQVAANEARVVLDAPTDIGGLLLTFRPQGLDCGEPILSAAAAGMKVRARTTESGELKILIYGWDANAFVASGHHQLLSLATNGSGSLELVGVEISDAQGALLAVRQARAIVPEGYALLQNYPNPFNAGTVIPIALPQAGEWSITICNVAGQTVRRLQGFDGPGPVQVAWDGRAADGAELASGVYFYRLDAGAWTATRKMILLK
ncbi:MAG TPA: FlgD immunoglobulin-like domain containing protein [bacterium]|nr:FlgD immunoglobulin-like domain containing protein [bacterium]